MQQNPCYKEKEQAMGKLKKVFRKIDNRIVISYSKAYDKRFVRNFEKNICSKVKSSRLILAQIDTTLNDNRNMLK